MSFRVHATVVVDGETVLKEQVLGNYEDFSESLKTKYGIDTENTEEWNKELSVNNFISLFRENFIMEIEKFKDGDWDKVIQSFKDPKSLTNMIPSWTLLGNAAIVINSFSGFLFQPNAVVKLSAG